jgi:hypothetical protein
VAEDDADFDGLADGDFDGVAEDDGDFDGLADGDFDGVAGVDAEGATGT